MKKPLLFALLVITALSSCKKSGDPGSDNPYELPYNKEGVTANKSFLEGEGRDFVKQIEDLSDLPAIKALESLAEIDVPEISITATTMARVGRSNAKIAALNKAVNQVASLGATTETYRLSQGFGVYTYNHQNGDWVKTSASDRMEFHFPATKGGRSNNAVFTVTYKSSGKTHDFETTEYDWDYSTQTETSRKVTHRYELPSEVKASLKIGGSSALDLTSTYSYHNDNLPKSANVSLALGAYTFTSAVNNDNQHATVGFAMKKGNSVLLSANAGSNFDQISYDKIENEGGDFGEWISDANLEIGIGNVKVAGLANTKAISQALNNVGEEPDYNSYVAHLTYPNWDDYNDWDAYDRDLQLYWEEERKAYDKYDADYAKYDKAYQTALANALNQHASFAIVNTKSNERIASLVFEIAESRYQYGESVSYYYDIEALLVFGDGSKIDMETFGETGFDKLISDIEDLLEKFDY